MAKIIADSSADMVTDASGNFVSVPILIYTDDKKFLDDGTVEIGEMLEYLENYSGKTKTACPNTEDWITAFGGDNEIYIVTLTSNLSGTFNSANVAKAQYLESNPDAKIAIFDTLSTGPEMRMTVEKIAELKNAGESFENIVQKIQEYINSVRLFFVLKSIRNLAQNGRVNKLAATAIGVLGISIVGIASDIGTIKPIAKVRGEKKVIEQVLKELEKINYSGGKVYISNVENPELSNLLTDAIKSKYPQAETKIYSAGALCSFYAERKGIIIGVET